MFFTVAVELRGSFGQNACFGHHSEHSGLFKEFIVKSSSFFFFLSAKEEEKQKLLKWSSDLKQEREQLEQKVKQLSNSISVSKLIPSVVGADIALFTRMRVLGAPEALSGPQLITTVNVGRHQVCLQL